MLIYNKMLIHKIIKGLKNQRSKTIVILKDLEEF